MLTIPQARAVLDAANAAGTMADIPAIAFVGRLLPGFDPHDPTTLTSRSMVVEAVVDPRLEALLTCSSATRTGAFSWTVPLGEENGDATPLIAAIDCLAEGSVVTGGTLRKRTQYGELRSSDGWPIRDLVGWLRGTPWYWELSNYYPNGTYRAHNPRTERMRPRVTVYGDETRAVQLGALLVTRHGNGPLYLKVVADAETLVERVPGHLPQVRIGTNALGLPGTRGPRTASPVTPAEAIAVLNWLSSVGCRIDDGTGDDTVAVLATKVASQAVAWPVPGRPAQAMLSVGLACPVDTSGLGLREVGVSRLGMSDSAEVARLVADLGDASGIHPGVLDVARMRAAAPYSGDDRLRGYQMEAVGLHLATSLGWVNTIEPGMGKTVTTLTAMRVRAEQVPAYRGLVVCEANVRSQWAGEASIWFPQAQVVQVTSAKDLPVLVEAVAQAGDRPLLVITSYALAAQMSDEASAVVHLVDLPADKRGQLRLFAAGDDGGLLPYTAFAAPAPTRVGDQLAAVRWHDLAADEATALRSTGSRQTEALWRLRGNADVAVALTGTPINRSLDDLGRLLAWARGDRDMFHSRSLSTQFSELGDDTVLQDYLGAIGPLVFRRDKSEIADELPTVTSRVVRLTARPAEVALANAARDELKRALDDLMALLEVAEDATPGDESLAEVRDSLTQARGTFLGGTTLARMAASDPHAVATSTSGAAALLAGQGLVEAATAEPGTKRTWCVSEVTRLVDEGHPVLVFTSFATVAEGLLQSLMEAGVRAGGILGGGGKVRDRNVEAFRNGTLDCLVATSSGEKGLNLQRAAVVIHLDLPWTPDKIVQRTGRAERIGSTNAAIEVVFPIVEDTIEERVAAVVVTRAATALQALDAHRGAKVDDTDMGRTIAGLLGDVDMASLKSSEKGLLAITRELLAA